MVPRMFEPLRFNCIYDVQEGPQSQNIAYQWHQEDKRKPRLTILFLPFYAPSKLFYQSVLLECVAHAKMRSLEVQSTLVFSKFRGLSEILRDIRTSTYKISRNEVKINWTSIFQKWIRNLSLEVRDILKVLWKRGEIVFLQYFVTWLDFHVKTETRFSLRDKRLFEISAVDIRKVDCTWFPTPHGHNVIL